MEYCSFGPWCYITFTIPNLWLWAPEVTLCMPNSVRLWTVARQAPLSMGFSRQQYWSGLSCPPPGNLPDPGIEPRSLMSPALAGRFFTTSATWEAPEYQRLNHLMSLFKSLVGLGRLTLFSAGLSLLLYSSQSQSFCSDFNSDVQLCLLFIWSYYVALKVVYIAVIHLLQAWVVLISSPSTFFLCLLRRLCSHCGCNDFNRHHFNRHHSLLSQRAALLVCIWLTHSIWEET